MGTQSLRNDLVCIPDKFLLKFDPPKICVVYHFKNHKAEDQYYRDLPLKYDKDINAQELTDWLFKAHHFYFDEKIVKKDQVKKLMIMIVDKQANFSRVLDRINREKERAAGDTSTKPDEGKGQNWIQKN